MNEGKNEKILSSAEINRVIEEYKRAAGNGNTEERDRLFAIIYESNLKLFYKIMQSRYPTYMAVYKEDMLQYCACEMFNILPTYDPEKAVFTTYLTPSVIHACQQCVDDINGLTAHYSVNIRKIKRYLEKAEMENLSETVYDISAATGVPVYTVEKCLEKIRNKQVSAVTDSGNIMDQTKSNEKSPEEMTIEKEEKDVLMRSLNTLDEESRNILLLKYGFARGGRTMTDTQIAEMLGVSKQTIRRITIRAQNRLRTILKKSSLFENRIISDEIGELSKNVVFIPVVSMEEKTEADMFMELNEDFF